MPSQLISGAIDYGVLMKRRPNGPRAERDRMRALVLKTARTMFPPGVNIGERP